MNKRRLSAFGTFFFKFMFPTIWIGGFGSGTFSLFQTDAEEKYIFLGALIIGSTLILLLTATLKKVSVDGSELVISNYFKKIRVPLSVLSG